MTYIIIAIVLLLMNAVTAVYYYNFYNEARKKLLREQVANDRFHQEIKKNSRRKEYYFRQNRKLNSENEYLRREKDAWRRLANLSKANSFIVDARHLHVTYEMDNGNMIAMTKNTNPHGMFESVTVSRVGQLDFTLTPEELLALDWALHYELQGIKPLLNYED